MNALILDSSTKILYIALIKNDSLVYEKYLEGKNDHAKNIVFCVDEALKTGNLNVDDLNRLVVGFGPGSYTGVRMAMTVVKMMAVFKEIPLYSISTLKLMSSGKKGIVKASVDARRGNGFAGIFDINNNEILLEEGLYSYEELKDKKYDFEVSENDYVVDPFYCLNNCDYVKEPHLLVPNYLRETEAERNLK